MPFELKFSKHLLTLRGLECVTSQSGQKLNGGIIVEGALEWRVVGLAIHTHPFQQAVPGTHILLKAVGFIRRMAPPFDGTQTMRAVGRQAKGAMSINPASVVGQTPGGCSIQAVPAFGHDIVSLLFFVPDGPAGLDHHGVGTGGR